MLGLAEELRHSTDAEDLTRVHERAAAMHIPPRTARDALDLVARLLIHTGRRMDEITTQDLLDYQAACRRKQREAHGLQSAYQLLRGLRVPGILDTPGLNIGRRRRVGQLSIEELVDHHSVGCRPVRDLLVRYLRERAPSLDYSSLRSLTSHLVRLFWTDLERHHPRHRLTASYSAARPGMEGTCPPLHRGPSWSGLDGRVHRRAFVLPGYRSLGGDRSRHLGTGGGAVTGLGR